MPEQHEAGVRHTLGRTGAEDKFTPTCPCGWEAKTITAGADASRNWQRAWAIADAHTHEETP